MRIQLIWILCFLSVGIWSCQTNSLKSEPFSPSGIPSFINTNILSRAETMSFDVHYGFIHAADLYVHTDAKPTIINQRGHYALHARLKTTGTSALITKIDDKWTSIIDTLTDRPSTFIRLLKENNYWKDEKTYFKHDSSKAEVHNLTDALQIEKKTVTVSPFMQDMISVSNYVRKMRWQDHKSGDTLVVDVLLDHRQMNLKIAFNGIKKIKWNGKQYSVYHLKPLLPPNKIFNSQDPIQVYMTADELRIPIKVKANFMIGAVEVDLVEYKAR